MRWIESSRPTIAITRSVIWSVTPARCATCGQLFGASMPAPLGSAPAARKTSISSAWPRFRGLRSVSFARKLWIAQRMRRQIGSNHRSSWRPDFQNRESAQQWAQRRKAMLWTLVAVCLILWLLGFTMSIGGGFIHLLLVVALVVFVINLVSGRRGLA